MEFAFLSLVEASALIRSRKLSPVDYAEALLQRIDRYDGRLSAFIRLTPEHALAQARQAEREITAGNWRGPLHGVPVALKDIIDVAGLPTTAHSKILIDAVAASDAAVTQRLTAAGAVLMGKLATHEFAIGGPCFDLPWPPARNPWGRRYFAGSSSSGSGAALAAGFVPLALGTDTGGSVRHPASLCGVVGLKPTYGLISRRGVLPLSFSLDHVGPMTRTVADNALLLQVLAGHDPLDKASADRPVPDYAASLGAGVAGLRLGVIRHFYERDGTERPHPETLAAFERALAVLRGLGAVLVDIEVPSLSVYDACGRIIQASEGFAVHERWLRSRPEDYGSITRERLLAGAFLRAADYLQAQRLRTRLTRAMTAALAGVDAALTLSSYDPAPPIDEPDTVAKVYIRNARMPFNVTGHPALSLPTGFSTGGLPLAMQIIGRHFDEATVFRVAAAYEQEAGWQLRHPDLEAARAEA